MQEKFWKRLMICSSFFFALQRPEWRHAVGRQRRGTVRLPLFERRAVAVGIEGGSDSDAGGDTQDILQQSPEGERRTERPGLHPHRPGGEAAVGSSLRLCLVL